MTSLLPGATTLAVRAHTGQFRKGTSVPYISHPLAVTSLVLADGGDDEVAAAAMLHDVVEDGGGMPMAHTIRDLFGDRVADIVLACSDSTSIDPDHKAPWAQRKRMFLDSLPSAGEDVQLVSAADKLHNAASILEDLRGGVNVWARFSAPPEQVLWYYTQVLDILTDSGLESRSLAHLAGVVADIRELSGLTPAAPPD